MTRVKFWRPFALGTMLSGAALAMHLLVTIEAGKPDNATDGNLTLILGSLGVLTFMSWFLEN